MRLSELSTDRAIDVFCAITPHITAILSDEELLAELRNAVVVDNATTAAERLAILGNKIAVLVPMLLRNHRCDILAIIAEINGRNVADIAEQSAMKTVAQIKELINDEELMSFFG